MKRISEKTFWQLQPGYPKVSSAGEKITTLYITDDLTGYPQPQDTLGKGKSCPLPGFTNLVVKDFSYEPIIGVNDDQDKTLYKVRIEFTKEDSAQNDFPADVWLREDNVSERPLEEHPNYKVTWNHYLARRNGVIGAFPETALLDNNDYRWLKDPSQIEDGWEVVSWAEKPGIQTYMQAAPVIVHRRHYTTYGSASSYSKEGVQVANPQKNFGFHLSNKHWLLVPSGISKDGNYWVVENRYIYSSIPWDDDIY